MAACSESGSVTVATPILSEETVDHLMLQEILQLSLGCLFVERIRNPYLPRTSSALGSSEIALDYGDPDGTHIMRFAPVSQLDSFDHSLPPLRLQYLHLKPIAALRPSSVLS